MLYERIWRVRCAALLGAGGGVIAGCGDSPVDLPVPSALEIISGDNQIGLPGVPLSQPLVVGVLDDSGQPMAGEWVRFVIPAGGGSVDPDSIVTTTDGSAETEWTLGSDVESEQAVEARVGTGTGQLTVTFRADAVNPPPAPSQVAATRGSNAGEIEISFERVAGANSHNLYWSTTRGLTKESANKIEDVTRIFDHEGRTSGITYYYAVTAVRDGIESVLSEVVSAVISDQVQIFIQTPEPGEFVGRTLDVHTITVSDFALASVTAQVMPIQTALTFSSGPLQGWIGSLQLDGLERGEHLLRVLAVDINGDSAAASRTVTLDEPPGLTVTEPLSYTVARPDVRIVASCTDDGPGGCSLSVNAKLYEVIGVPSVTVATGQDIDMTASLAQFEGNRVQLSFIAMDDAGQQTTVYRQPLFVESSPELTEVDTAPGPIVDVDATRILYLVEGDTKTSLIVQDRATETEEIVLDSVVHLFSGRLTPVGVVFEHHSEPASSDSLYEWNAGVVNKLTISRSGGLRTVGDFVAWGDFESGANSIIRRNVVTGQQVVAAPDGRGFELGPNGEVVYYIIDAANPNRYNIFHFTDLGTDQLTFDDPSVVWNTDPVTDGVNVVFTKSVPCCPTVEQVQIAAVTTSGEIALTPVQDRSRTGNYRYAAAGGWIAYTQVDLGGNRQVWRRSPSGEASQISFFGNNYTGITALSTTGDLLIQQDQRFFVSRVVDPSLREISSSHGSVRWLGSTLILMIGRSVLQLN